MTSSTKTKSHILLKKKLITRWDSERELLLRRHRARTTKYETYCPTIYFHS